jgi:metal-responsive CopG/Arc/MetJ family transcriptional regulator
VGRKKEFPNRVTLPLSDEMLAELDKLVTEDENRLAIIREAIDREIRRRQRQKP